MTTLINHWIKHPELKREEELLVHLYRMRMATSENLAAPMGISFRTVRGDLIPSLYAKGKNIVLSHRMKDKKSSYYLGQEGCKIVSQLIGKKVNFYDYTGSQARHFEGINNILGRLVKRVGIERFKYQTEWYFTRQARNLNEGGMTKDDAASKLDALPEPDARFVIPNKKACWIEFDNDTESRGKIKEKMIDYVETMIPMNNHDKIFWVVTKRSPKRKDYLEEVWQEVQNSEGVQQFRDGYGDEFFLPSMHFCVEGEETDPILFL